MVYIVVLNWNNYSDTIECMNSLFQLTDVNYKIVICDNGSTDSSLDFINKRCSDAIFDNDISYTKDCELVLLKKSDCDTYKTKQKSNGIYLIDIGYNMGYAAGNNVGISFSLKQPDMDYVWVLNNDTEVTSTSLYHLVDYISVHKDVGICGSKLVYFHNRNKIQGLGGVFNQWFCTSKHYANNKSVENKYDDEYVSKEIDYVIGASMLLSRRLIDSVGLISEDYFLYYEEIDYCIRAKRNNFKIACASQSVVYHKEGGTININKSVTILSDYYSVRNRLVIAKKFFPCKQPIVYFSLFGVLFNRIIRKEYKKSLNILSIIMFFNAKF